MAGARGIVGVVHPTCASQCLTKPGMGAKAQTTTAGPTELQGVRCNGAREVRTGGQGQRRQ
eukprot:2156711-Lingulodinium_polyedra.AAC.1